MAKVEFDIGIDLVTGVLMGSDPYYLRRYPKRDGGVMHIVQARPNRSGHTPSLAESTNRVTFGELFGRQNTSTSSNANGKTSCFLTLAMTKKFFSFLNSFFVRNQHLLCIFGIFAINSRYISDERIRCVEAI